MSDRMEKSLHDKVIGLCTSFLAKKNSGFFARIRRGCDEISSVVVELRTNARQLGEKELTNQVYVTIWKILELQHDSLTNKLLQELQTLLEEEKTKVLAARIQAWERDMQEMPNYYQILGIPETATSDEIARAYRSKSLQCHPDRNPGNVEEANKQCAVNEAGQCLKNCDEKIIYDMKLQQKYRYLANPEEEKTLQQQHLLAQYEQEISAQKEVFRHPRVFLRGI